MDSNLYEKCFLCPRNCAVNRALDNKGFCKEVDTVRAACACLHFGEEPPISAKGGSGTIFISGCNLGCVFCQNYQISQQGMGKELSVMEFAQVCLKLQDFGAENINIVTGSHAVPILAAGISKAKVMGLSIPVCWNSSAYEKIDVLNILDGLVDIWLPDLKTMNREVSKKLFKAEDYPQYATEGILAMVKKTPLKMKGQKMLSGVIVRHLFLPGRLEDTVNVLDWLKHNVDGKAYVSLMSQYTPVSFAEDEKLLNKRMESLSLIENRFVSQDEFNDIQDLIQAYDFKYLFYQELEQDATWLPDFNQLQPFSNELAKPVWHWKEGFVHSFSK
ncbi:MAG: radical SAM protein [Spirochaetaceae bacterium]|nr:radical SAM protein [Spirochaetaceae bacterium]